MAKPQQVQKLRKGRILTGKNFPAFADTFNYYGEFIENLKGDADIRPDSGSIQVDRTSPEHPVVRFVGDKAATVDSQLPDLHLSSA